MKRLLKWNKKKRVTRKEYENLVAYYEHLAAGLNSVMSFCDSINRKVEDMGNVRVSLGKFKEKEDA